MSSEGPGSRPWRESSPVAPEVVDAFLGVVAATRRLQHLVNGSRPSVEGSLAVRKAIEEANALLEGFRVEEDEQIAGRQGVAGRAQTLVPPVYYDYVDSERMRTRLTWGHFYLGGNDAAHGGAIPLVFDEVFGLLAVSGGRLRSRTAYLKVNYRSITPLDREVQLEATVERVEGRKVFITGRMTDGDRLLADAEGLFVMLKPGQP